MSGEVWIGEQPWRPEVEAGPAAARAWVDRAWSDLAGVPLTPLGAGWDNTVYRLGASHLVRIPHRALAGGLMEVEWALLRAVGGRLPLPVPRPERIAGPFEDYPWRFVLCPYLPGRTACRAHLDRGRREAAIAPVARFLRALHSVPLTDAGLEAVPFDELDRIEPSVRIPRAARDLARAADLALIRDPGPLERLLEAVPEGWRPGATALVHGDLYARHLLVDEAGAPCGVIDWGDGHRGEPAVDLSFVRAFFPPGARGPFEREYGAIDDDRWAAAGMRALQSALNIGLYGLEIGDADLVRESRCALEHLAAD